jgi:hypothetical protein
VAFFGKEFASHPRLQLDEANGSLLGVSCLGGDAGQEERHPRAQVARSARAHQQVVVLIAVLLEVDGKVEQRLRQHLTVDQDERDQQPAEPAIPVEKRVDHFELVVSECQVDEERQLPVVEELFEVVERRAHRVDRGRHERRVRR